MKIKKFDSHLIVAFISGSLVMTFLIALDNYKTLEFEKNKDEDIKLKLEKLQDEEK